MEDYQHQLEHPKKRRRREVERRPLNVKLVFDDTLKGDAAIVPNELWNYLGYRGRHEAGYRLARNHADVW
jgi:hypothetical protein